MIAEKHKNPRWKLGLSPESVPSPCPAAHHIYQQIMSVLQNETVMSLQNRSTSFICYPFSDCFFLQLNELATIVCVELFIWQHLKLH